MFEKFEYGCLVGCIALIGAERIDLFLGHGPFKLTPFLLLASIVVGMHFLIAAFRGRFRFAMSPPLHRQLPFLMMLAALLFISVASTLFGLNPLRGVVALADFILVSVLGYCISVRILTDPDPEKLVLRSISFSLLVYLIFCIGGAIAFSHGAYRLEEEGSISLESMFAPTANMFGIVPRLSGFSLDANRAGFLLVMYLVLLDYFATRTRYTRFLRFVIGVFLLLAVSRSAFLCWLAYYLFSSGWKSITTKRTAFRAAVVAVLCLLVGLVYRKEIGELLDLWQVSDMISDRLSGAEGTSGGDHIQLIQRGLETWSSSAHTIIAGIGFEAAPRVLGDFFGENKFGNFHSLYVSILAELGLPAFLLFMVLLLYPMMGRKGAAAGIAAIAVFNIALQSYMEPFFWMALALAWSLELRHWGPRHVSSELLAIP
jgi:hypothetical protein